MNRGKNEKNMNNVKIIENSIMPKHMYILILLCVVMMCNGCRATRNQTVGGRSTSDAVVVDTTPPNGSQLYQRGWQDGCESGLAELNGMVKFPYKNYVRRVDNTLIYNAAYWNTWNAAHKYCSFTVLTEKEYDQ
jgi:hypothetical protein